MKRPLPHALATATLVALVVMGPSSAAPAAKPAFTTAPCPAGVALHTQGRARCGYLTVPENRGDSTGRSIKLFVVRDRPAGRISGDPVLSFPELGFGKAPWAEPDGLSQRVHREVINLDPRGVGGSEPSLACAEVEREIRHSLAPPLSAPATRARLVAAASACRKRLSAAGIDLAAYNVTESAADAEDLRVALGIERWNVRAHGSSARIAFEILRRHPAHVRAVWLDSPEIPQVDLLTAGILSTRSAIARITAACRAAKACKRAFPSVTTAVAKNLGTAQRTRRTVRARRAGATIPIVLDETTTLRAYRDGTAWRPQLLPIAAAANSLRDAEAGYDWIADNPAFTLGYVADAGASFTFAHGAFLSTVCHDQLPFITDAALVRSAGGSVAHRRTFAESPLPAVCEVWDVGSASPEIHEPVRSNVPVLMLVGRFDPFSGPWLARRAARTLGRAYVVELPYWGYNTLGDSCAVAIRNAWIDRPTVPPSSSCLKGRRIEFATG